jgi:O-antigen/teichoic acid export membrane protein
LGFILIPKYGVLGVIIGNLVSGIPSMLWGLHWVWRHYEAKADFHSSARILAASALAGAVTYLPTRFLGTANWIKLIIGLAIFLTVYVLGAPLMGAVSVTDINNLRTMFSGLGIVTKIIKLPLNVAEKVALTRSANREEVDTP